MLLVALLPKERLVCPYLSTLHVSPSYPPGYRNYFNDSHEGVKPVPTKVKEAEAQPSNLSEVYSNVFNEYKSRIGCLQDGP